MSTSPHPLASHHLPAFIAAPGGPDILFVVTTIVFVLMILIVGTLLLKLHSLPERMAHRSKKLQFDIVAVLGLLSLFTHQHIFWVAALLLALIDFPDFTAPFNRIAGSLERIAGATPDNAALETQPDSVEVQPKVIEVQPKAVETQAGENARHA